MSWLSKIIGFGAAVVGIATGGWIGAIAKTVVTGYVVGKVTAAINKKNTPEKPPDPGVRAQVEPNPEHKVPVVYGTATLGGIVTDAQLTNSNQTMWYCVTICEQTGRLNLGQGALSTLYFDEIYWNDQRVAFASDGVTAASTTDRDGVVDTKINGLVKIYCYSGSSSNVMAPGGYVVATPTNAADLMPGWGADYNMPGLVFALIRVDYNKDKGITGLGNVTFRIRNNMTQSGDCLYDYLTNTWYGAGIQATEIYVS